MHKQSIRSTIIQTAFSLELFFFKRIVFRNTKCDKDARIGSNGTHLQFGQTFEQAA